MSRARSTPNFEGKAALILHRPHAVVEALLRQLSQLGMRGTAAWPQVPEAGSFDILFYDADMGYDEQFPWLTAPPPVPAIALIGSEAPGRLTWAIGRGADAHMLKPVGSGGVFSALVIATEAFARRKALHAELEGLRLRIERRQVLAEATACLMVQEHLSASDAYASLRRQAMASQLTIEEIAERIVDRLRDRHVRDRA